MTNTPTEDSNLPPDIDELVRTAADVVSDRKGERIRVLQLAEITSLTDYFLICTGTSNRQVQAIADGVADALRDVGVRPLHVEGKERGQWVLLDYGDFVVHVFLEEQREFYGLDKLWGDAPDVTGRFEPEASPAS